MSCSRWTTFQFDAYFIPLFLTSILAFIIDINLMKVTPAFQKLVLNCASFIFLIYLTSAYELQFTIFLLAFFLMGYNLWIIIQSIFMRDENEQFRNTLLRSTRASVGSSQINEENVRRFESSIKAASNRVVHDQRDLNNDPSKLFSSFSRESESIQ